MAKCDFDPTPLIGEPIGMFHCPSCGEMVIAGMPHPDYDLLDDEGLDGTDIRTIELTGDAERTADLGSPAVPGAYAQSPEKAEAGVL